MSSYCPECTMLSYDEERCQYCGKQLKYQKTYKPKNKKPYLINSKQNETIEINKNILIIVAISIIAISIGYLAITKYKERREEDKVLKILFGTDDRDKIIKETGKTLKQIEQMQKNAFKDYEKLINQTNNMFKK